MTHEIEEMYAYIISFLAADKANKDKLPCDMVSKMEYIIAHNGIHNGEISEYLACYILDDRVTGSNFDAAMSLIKDAFKNTKGGMPENVYHRVLKLAIKANQQTAVDYLVQAFDAHAYDAISALGVVLLSGKIRNFKVDALEYRDVVYDLLIRSMAENNEYKFMGAMYHLLQGYQRYPNQDVEYLIQIIENLRFSEYWGSTHEAILEEFLFQRVSLSYNLVLRLDQRLNIRQTYNDVP